MSNATNLSRKELDAAPERNGWQEPAVYASIYLLPTRTKHDSGFAHICIVGMRRDGTLEKAAWCDDICWKHTKDPIRHYTMRCDMTFPGNVVHCWGWDTEFVVGASLSSTDITVRSTKP